MDSLIDWQIDLHECMKINFRSFPSALQSAVITRHGQSELTWFIVGQLADSRPVVLRGDPQDLQGHMTAISLFRSVGNGRFSLLPPRSSEVAQTQWRPPGTLASPAASLRRYTQLPWFKRKRPCLKSFQHKKTENKTRSKSMNFLRTSSHFKFMLSLVNTSRYLFHVTF